MRVLLSGGEAAGARALRVLTDRGLTPRAVATDPDSALADRAAADGVEVLPAAAPSEPSFADWIAAERIDVLLNVHSLHIVHKSVLAQLAVGGFNLHPGPLPAYAGLNAPSWAVINGESEHAVTLHRMDAGIDTGTAVAVAWFDLDHRSTGLSVSGRCASLGMGLVEDLVQRLVNGDPLPSVATTGERRLYRAADRPFDGRVPWHEANTVIDRMVRGCAFHPLPSPIGTPMTSVDDREVGVLSGAPLSDPARAPDSTAHSAPPGTVLDAALPEGAVAVLTGDGIYRIDRVTVDGTPVPAAEVLSAGQVLT